MKLIKYRVNVSLTWGHCEAITVDVFFSFGSREKQILKSSYLLHSPFRFVPLSESTLIIPSLTLCLIVVKMWPKMKLRNLGEKKDKSLSFHEAMFSCFAPSVRLVLVLVHPWCRLCFTYTFLIPPVLVWLFFPIAWAKSWIQKLLMAFFPFHFIPFWFNGISLRCDFQVKQLENKEENVCRQMNSQVLELHSSSRVKVCMVEGCIYSDLTDINHSISLPSYQPHLVPNSREFRMQKTLLQGICSYIIWAWFVYFLF